MPPSPVRSCRRRVPALWLSAAILWGTAAVAAEAPVRSFHVPAGEALTTLKEFVEQSGEQVFYFVGKVSGARTEAVAGEMTPRTALERMLEGTDLRAVQDERTGALSVIEREARKPAPARAPPLSAQPSPVRRPPAPPPAGGSDEILRLPQFSVSDQMADPYRPAEAVSAARIRGQLLETPLSIDVVTRELLDDLGANSLYEATRYFSGVSNGRGAGAGGIMDRQDFRGFESNTKTIDNFSSLEIPGNSGFVAIFDPAFVERAEVVLGPDSILSPTGSPGGSMNLITKSPQFRPESDLSLEVGNYNSGKVTVDSTGPIGEGSHWAYRAIGVYQDGATYVPGSIENWNGSAQLTYRFSDTAELTIKYIGEQWELTGATANANDNGWEVTDPGSVRGATIGNTPPPGSGFTYDGWHGNASWSHTFDRVNLVSAQLTAPIAGRINARLAAEIFNDNNIGDSAYPSASPTETFDPATGQVIGLSTIDPASLPEVARFNHGESRQTQVQNDYAANFDPGPVTLQPVAGWTYQQGEDTGVTRQDSNLPPANLFAGVYDPPKPDLLTDYSLSADTGSNARQAQVYALTKTGFDHDQIFLSAGVSRTWIESNTSTFAVTNLSAPPARIALDGFKDTFLGGVLAKPTNDVSCYCTFSSNASITTSPDNAPLWQQGKQQEYGVKLEFFNQRLAFTAAHFQIIETNLTSPNPAFNVDPAHNPASILTDDTNHGFEFNVVGGLTRNLSVIGSLTDMKFRDFFGRRARNVPDQLANLLLNYHFTSGALRNLGLFAGVVHMGATAGENPPNKLTALNVPEQVGFYVAAWTVYNAGASYRWDRYRLNLNVDNVLNSKFIWEPASRLSVSPYPGATVRLTLTARLP